MLVQGLLAAWLLRVATRAFFGWSEPARFLVLVGVLTLGSSLPWFTGQILPDVFTGVLVLGAAVLGLAGDRCSPRERIALTALVGASILFHQSHVLLGIGLLVLFAAARAARFPTLAWRDVLRVALPVVVATAALVVTNGRTSGHYGPSVDGAAFLLANSVQDGPTLAYLRETCPERRWALCPYLHLLPWPEDDEFLWNARAPFFQAGGFVGLRREARQIVLGSFLARPMAFGVAVLQGGWRQLLHFPTGGDNVSYVTWTFPSRTLRVLFPRSFPATPPRSRASAASRIRPSCACTRSSSARASGRRCCSRSTSREGGCAPPRPCSW